jgi:hypothetical protein
VDLAKIREDCEHLLAEALDSKDYERAVEAHIFYARYCAIEIPFTPTPAIALQLKTAGMKHVNVALDLWALHGGKLNSLVPEVEDVKRSLNGGTFMQTVSSEERRAVLAAMAKEFSGTGHWYTCVNGHPFAVGECGMPMEQTRCPHCDAAIGGQHHRPAQGVARAEELERELRDMTLGR